MAFLLNRRTALAGALLSSPALYLRRASAKDGADAVAEARLEALETKGGGRLGVAIVNVATGQRIGRRMDERFAMCSTFKFLAASLVLTRVDKNQERLDRRIVFSKDQIVPYSPTTEKHIGGEGMTVGQICEAAITLSDNTAGNLMLASFGGPAALTAFARTLGDPATRLDRNEPDLNEATPGDPRDTTTPAAMAENMRKLVIGDALSQSSRTQLATWLTATKTGDKRLRAGLPKDWRIGDKTGTGGAHGPVNDVAVAWRPGGGPIIVTAYFTESSASDEERNGVLAEVGRIAAAY
jgi:beta-lactamase class A